MRLVYCALLFALIASPVMAKRGVDIGCVPSPDPNVPPCNLDQSPMVPSLIKASTKEKSSSKGRTRTPQVRGGKAARGVKGPIGCVPSPDPNVPPCDLDQTPVMPSDLENAAGEKEKPQGDVPVKAHKTPSYSAKKPTGKAKP